MNILAIDTTAPFFSIAFRSEGEEDYFFQDDKQWQHAEHLLDKINNLIPDFSSLNCLMVSKGPGGFTGLRIGLAIAKAFKIALPNLKIITPTHFQLLAHQYFVDFPGQKEVTVIIDAKRGEVVMQKIDSSLSYLTDMVNLPIDELKITLDENIVLDNKITSEFISGGYLIENISARQMLDSLSLLKGIEGDFEPLYYRPSDAKLPSNQLS